MLGARSMVGTAVGSRPKLKTVSTRAVNTAAERKAVRVRNSSTRSLRAITQACRSMSGTDHRQTIRVRNVARAAGPARRKMHKAAPRLERHVGRELDTLVHVVRREHHDPPGPRQLR